jgi:hypothetical protein
MAVKGDDAGSRSSNAKAADDSNSFDLVIGSRHAARWRRATLS